MAELNEKVVALFHLAQDLIKPQSGQKRFQCLARFRMIGDGHIRREEPREHLPPTGGWFARLVGNGRIAGQKHGYNLGGTNDLEGVQAGAAVTELQSEFVVPVQHPLLAVVETDFVTTRRIGRHGRKLGIADVDGECHRLVLPRGGSRALDHQPPRFRLYGGYARVRGIAEDCHDSIIALGKRHGKEERLSAGHSPSELRRFRAEVEAITGLLGINRVGGDSHVAGSRGTSPKIEMEGGAAGGAAYGCRARSDKGQGDAREAVPARTREERFPAGGGAVTELPFKTEITYHKTNRYSGAYHSAGFAATAILTET